MYSRNNFYLWIMKEKILSILRRHYDSSGIASMQDDSAAEDIMQLICDELTGEKFRYFGYFNNWRENIEAELLEDGFSDQQIRKSLAELMKRI